MVMALPPSKPGLNPVQRPLKEAAGSWMPSSSRAACGSGGGGGAEALRG